MAKRTLIISIVALALTIATTLTVEAREFRTTKQKNEKSTPKIKTEKKSQDNSAKSKEGRIQNEEIQRAFESEMAGKPAAAGQDKNRAKNSKKSTPDNNQTVVHKQNTVAIAGAGDQSKGIKAEKVDKNPKKTVKADKAPQGTVTPLVPSTSKSAYIALENEHKLLSEKIDLLTTQLSGASKGKAKKLSKQINELTAQRATIERRMGTFPQSVKNPTSTPAVEVDAQFNRELDAKVAARVAAMNPYEGQISNDPQLEKLYRERLGESERASDPNATTYRVMIAITKTPLPKSAFYGLSDIIEQRTSGGVVYYQGSYSSRNDAEKACNKILSARKFRDAFVVAMQGDKRVALP